MKKRKKIKIKIIDLIRAEGREPGGQSTCTVWTAKWGETFRRLPDDGKPQRFLCKFEA